MNLENTHRIFREISQIQNQHQPFMSQYPHMWMPYMWNLPRGKFIYKPFVFLHHFRNSCPSTLDNIEPLWYNGGMLKFMKGDNLWHLRPLPFFLPCSCFVVVVFTWTFTVSGAGVFFGFHSYWFGFLLVWWLWYLGNHLFRFSNFSRTLWMWPYGFNFPVSHPLTWVHHCAGFWWEILSSGRANLGVLVGL